MPTKTEKTKKTRITARSVKKIKETKEVEKKPKIEPVAATVPAAKTPEEKIEEAEILTETKNQTYQAVGRRKSAIARVRLILNRDQKEKVFTVNSLPVEKYFSLEQYKKQYLEPLRTTNTLNRFDVSVKIKGSGLSGQLGAMILGISRALVKVDPERFKKILRKRGFLTRDPRAKERKKVGLMGARKVKQSPKR